MMVNKIISGLDLPKVDLSMHLNNPKPVTWLFAGDSITQGQVHTRGYRDYTQLFKERLSEMGRIDVVINSGVGGWNIVPLYEQFEERIGRFHPDVLFLMFGTNDAVLGPERIDLFIETIGKTVTAAFESQIKTVVLQTTVPMSPIDPEMYVAVKRYNGEFIESKIYGIKRRLSYIGDYAEAMKKAGACLSIPVIDHWSVWEEIGGNLMQLLDGGFHPNEYGHRLIAQTIFSLCGMWEDRSWSCRQFVPV